MKSYLYIYILFFLRKGEEKQKPKEFFFFFKEKKSFKGAASSDFPGAFEFGHCGVRPGQGQGECVPGQEVGEAGLYPRGELRGSWQREQLKEGSGPPPDRVEGQVATPFSPARLPTSLGPGLTPPFSDCLIFS